MKSYLLGLFAMILAVTLASFTSMATVEKKTTDGPALIWFHVDGNNEVDPGDPLNTVAMDRDAFASTFPGTCSGTGQPCVRGYYSNGLPSSSTDPGVEDIEKN